MSEPKRYYWDSSVFVSFFNKEKGRFTVVNDLLKDAYSGKSEIVTSAFTLTEVLKVKNSDAITESHETKLQTFFEYPFVVLVEADRSICERARSFVWKHGMKPKDAVHVATAEFAAKMKTINALFSWDSDFTRLDGKVPGVNFALREPFMHQPLLPLEDSAGESVGPTAG